MEIWLLSTLAVTLSCILMIPQAVRVFRSGEVGGAKFMDDRHANSERLSLDRVGCDDGCLGRRNPFFLQSTCSRLSRFSRYG